VMRIFTLAAVVALATVTTASGQVTSSVPLGDEYFAMRAYSDGLAEISVSQLAVSRATQPNVREFAERMVRDHTKCNNDIVELARQKGIALPVVLDAVHSAAINRLAAISGSDFDRAYLKAQMCAHMGALHLFGHEARKGEDQQLKAFADKHLATLQDHAKSSFELAGEKQEYQKLCKIHDYAKQVMAEK
jgi:putative membrane protein